MKKLLFLLLAIFLILQFIPFKKPELKKNNPNDFILNNEMPEDISLLLGNSCYDCHSLEAKLPWYSKIAPVSWLVYRDINVGLHELNFSEWESLSKLKKAQKINECIEAVEDKEMPLGIYTAIHNDAKLSDSQIQEFKVWGDNYAENLFNNPTGLKRND